MSKHIGLYGKSALIKDKCPSCQDYAFVIDNKFQCCDTYAPLRNYSKIIRYSKIDNLRCIPRTDYMIEQLKRQNNQCFYCGLDLFKAQWNNKRVKYITLKVNWDHCIPYSFYEDNRDINFVAACSEIE